jgi:hypothetical protein
MNRFKLVLYILVLISLFIINTTETGWAFRCGDEVVVRGDSSGALVFRCGEPTYKEKIAGSTTGSYSQNTQETNNVKSGKAKKEIAVYGKYTERSETVEKWFYNCGSQDFVYVLEIKGGIIVSESTNGYGKGESDCKGGKSKK